MIEGFLIYKKEDVEKNRKFIRMCTENLEKNSIVLELKVIGEQNPKEIIKQAAMQKISFAINRSRDSSLSKSLENIGVRVFNHSRITETGNDKWKTYQLAKKLDIPVMYTEKDADSGKIGYPKVIKSCKGHGGSEVFLVQDREEQKKAVAQIGSAYIVQEYADAGGRDIRAYVIGGRCVLAMCRKAVRGFKSNFSLGGVAEPYILSETEEEIIQKICRELKPDYIGIDFIYNGDCVVLNEIEDAAGARMVYETTDVNIVEMFTDYIKEELLPI